MVFNLNSRPLEILLFVSNSNLNQYILWHERSTAANQFLGSLDNYSLSSSHDVITKMILKVCDIFYCFYLIDLWPSWGTVKRDFMELHLT